MKIECIEPLVLHVSEKTNWFFIRITTDNGLTGVGEASLNGWEQVQIAYLNSIASRFIGMTIDELMPQLRVFVHSPGGLVASSVISALEQAITDVRAKRAGVPINVLLGKAVRKSVPVYANINRGARDRSPDGVAQSARSAVASGFNAVKIAPFDGAYYADVNKRDFKSRTKAGIERVYAIREAVGADVKIMVDCHWRLDKQAALDLMSDLKAARISWLECPISENPDRYSDMAQLRAAANSHGMKLAGAERQIAVAGFAPFIEQQLVDVIMPDIKYAGGYAEMLRIALKCKLDGVDFSPHNPTGPICNLASMHLCMVAPAFLVLEHQLAESSLYFDVVKGYRPKLVNGCFKVPDAPGIGVELDDAVLRAHPYRALPPDANLDPRLG